jgi:hypothetical protein
LLGQRLSELGEPVPGSGEPDAAEIPSDAALKDFILNTPVQITQKIIRQNPRALGIFDAASQREAQKTITAWDKKQQEIKAARAARPGSPENPIIIRNVVGTSIKEKSSG